MNGVLPEVQVAHPDQRYVAGAEGWCRVNGGFDVRHRPGGKKKLASGSSARSILTTRCRRVTRAGGRGMPGPSAEFPPDSPPTRTVTMFPIVFDAPSHYANPVSGRTALPPLPSIDQQLLMFPLPPARPLVVPTNTGE